MNRRHAEFIAWSLILLALAAIAVYTSTRALDQERPWRPSDIKTEVSR